ncbi:dephospho-CoA kinase [Polycladidibacter hongkongensis]|uniref:dephospho-CoA kinase n=1 Tax=Polycladidibacter hongkongensis TaxID=1647556 RepID=UPI00082CEB29|nr:dephospho-CoA kinase [Pseudovibrio hongkongensis]
MKVLGLTGSIGMGKSTTAGLFKETGAAVYDADAAVHQIYADEAVAPVAQVFPEALVEGKIDRQVLAKYVLGDAAALARLEAIVHPLVQAKELAFLENARRQGHAFAVLDIPLLLDKPQPRALSAVVVVSSPPELQKQRVLARPHMSPDKFAAILAKQMPDAQKRAKAHFIVDTSRSLADARSQVYAIVRALGGYAPVEQADKKQRNSNA